MRLKQLPKNYQNLKMSKVFMPVKPDELWGVLDENPEAVVYAGGTDLLVKLRSQHAKPACLICLERLDDFKGITTEGDEIFIGALTTHREMVGDPIVVRDLRLMATATKSLGSPPVRNMGTLAGNIVTASPAGDTLAPLYVLNAQLEIRSRSATRRAPIESFILGPGKVDLNHGEIVSRIIVSKSPKFGVHHYEKVGRRDSLACAVVSMAALVNVTDDNIISKIRLAWGSVGPTIMRFRSVESFLEGKALSIKGLSEAVRLVKESVHPIDDLRASSSYRREVAGRLLLRLIGYAPCI